MAAGDDDLGPTGAPDDAPTSDCPAPERRVPAGSGQFAMTVLFGINMPTA